MYKKYIKRLLDIIISFCAIIILSPIYLIVAILVRIKLGSPIIFKQERPGLNEKIFTMYKFRTMLDKKDKNGEYLPDAERVSKFGDILRKTSLDELPELLNILKGDMSFVGPRPLLVEYLDLYNEKQKHRHDVRPGLTGLAQINGRNDTTWEKRFENDLKYIENISFKEDVKIFFMTFVKVFKADGISQKEGVSMEYFEGKENINTPFFIVYEQNLIENISSFKKALDELWNNNNIAYSVKTNSLPWIIKFMYKNNILAEVVSDEEYDLVKMCGYKDNEIIFNGPIKSNQKLKEAFENGAIVNIDSQNELDYIIANKPQINGKIGIRVNIDTSIFNKDDIGYVEDGFRFGFSVENGDFEKVLNKIKEIYPEQKIGLHLHVNSKTRSLEAYKMLSRYACKVIEKYKMQPSYIDIGGGFFGGVPNKPTPKEYISVIRDELKKCVNIEETELIIEPGSAFVGSAFDFHTTIIDAKDTNYSRILTTDGSRINIDPLWIKSRYSYSTEIEENENRELVEKQIVCGYTCMDHDRIMILNNEKKLQKGDKIVYHKVGNYTVTIGGLFIKYFPDVYAKTSEGKIEKIRTRPTVEEYYKIQS